MYTFSWPIWDWRTLSWGNSPGPVFALCCMSVWSCRWVRSSKNKRKFMEQMGFLVGFWFFFGGGGCFQVFLLRFVCLFGGFVGFLFVLVVFLVLWWFMMLANSFEYVIPGTRAAALQSSWTHLKFCGSCFLLGLNFVALCHWESEASCSACASVFFFPGLCMLMLARQYWSLQKNTLILHLPISQLCVGGDNPC